ncbi:MAG: hypothetical protein L0Y57_02400 [Beijerinckiaceae bacterium]|nr:hypothetical protein [Beijerinckiaceae bacterium]
MPRPKQSKGPGFEDILAGFERQPAKEAPASPARRFPPRPEGSGTGSPSAENSLRPALPKISFPWPAKFPSLLRSFRKHAEDAYAEAVAGETLGARADRPGNGSLKEAQSAASKPAKPEDEAIAEELGLNPELGTIDLKRLRRAFAKQNHPDCCEPERRSGAERRMSIANMLIDEMLRRSEPQR